MDLAVAIARVRLQADQVIAGQLGLEALEHGGAGAVDRKQRAAGRVRQRLEADDADPAILDGRRRPPAAVRVEAGLVDVKNVQAGSRRCGQRAELIGEALRVVDHEAFGDEDKRLRRVDRSEICEQINQPGNRGVGLLQRFPRDLARVVFDAGAAHRVLVGARRHVRAFPRDGAVEHPQLAANNRERFPQTQVVRCRRAGLLVAGQTRDDLLGALEIAQERQLHRARAEADHSDAIGGQQLVDERLHGFHHRRAAAKVDARLIDGNHDQPAAVRVFVGAVPLGNGCAAFPRPRVLDNRYPFRAEHAPLLAVDLDIEVTPAKTGDRLAGGVNHRHVHKGCHVDGRLKPGNLLLSGGGCRREDEQEHQPQVNALLHFVTVGLYPWRARISECPSTSTLMLRHVSPGSAPAGA